MTKDQKLSKLMILADLKFVFAHANSDDKMERLLSAYHMQQAIEKTIKLKLSILGYNRWGHDIAVLIHFCDINNINIGIPSLIRKNAHMYTRWEASTRYYPTTMVNRNSIWAAYRVTVTWLNSGTTV